MKILILSWRDTKSPFSGGAEVFTHENARRWVQAGHQVTWFASDYGNCPQKEVIDGIKIIRAGNEVTVRFKAYEYYRKYFRGKFDLVVDQINTLPFFTPLYVKEKKIVLIFQLAREVWFYETFFPWSLIGFILEFLYLKIYTRIPVITVSESTRQDLLDLGFSSKVSVVSVGISEKPLDEIAQKDVLNPTLVYLGRLRNSKRVHHIIEAIYLVKSNIPNIKLRIIGAAGKMKYVQKLKGLINKYGLEDNVVFHGFVDENKKRELLQKAHAIVIASVREGWGLVVSEANALSTIAIGYNVPGLRDSIIDGQTGLLTEENTPAALARQILFSINSQGLYNKLCQNALEFSKKLSWDTSASESLKALEGICLGRR